jgi:uncharacterized membrane protein
MDSEEELHTYFMLVYVYSFCVKKLDKKVSPRFY